MTNPLPVLEDWSLVDLSGYIFMTGEVDGRLINVPPIESSWINAAGILGVHCVTGQDYQLGEESARHAAKYPGAMDRLRAFLGDPK